MNIEPRQSLITPSSGLGVDDYLRETTVIMPLEGDGFSSDVCWPEMISLQRISLTRPKTLCFTRFSGPVSALVTRTEKGRLTRASTMPFAY